MFTIVNIAGCREHLENQIASWKGLDFRSNLNLIVRFIFAYRSGSQLDEEAISEKIRNGFFIVLHQLRALRLMKASCSDFGQAAIYLFNSSTLGPQTPPLRTPF